MEFCTITFCVLIFTLKLAASSPFYGDELGRPSANYQTLGASHNGYVPEEAPLDLTRSQNFRSNNGYREPTNQELYGFSRNVHENNRPQVGSLLTGRQASNEFSTLPILNRNRYPLSSLGEKSSFLNNPSEPRFSSEPVERVNINFNRQSSGLQLSGLPVHNENIQNPEAFRDLQNERIRNIKPMHNIVSEPYYNPRQNMFHLNSYQSGAQIKNIPSNEHIQNVPEPPRNNGPFPNRGKIQNLHQLVGGPGYNVQQLISNPQIKEALQNIGTNVKKRYLIIHADGRIEHTDTLEPTIATNPNSLFLHKEQFTLNKNAPAAVTANPKILSSPTTIDEVGSSFLTANPLEDLKLNNEEIGDGPFDVKELFDEEIKSGLSKTSKKPLKTITSLTDHFKHKTPKNSHNLSSNFKPSPSDDDEKYEESETKAELLTPSIAEYTDEEDYDEKNSLKKSSDPKKYSGTTPFFTKLFKTEYNGNVKSKISTSTTKTPPIYTTTSQHHHTHTITPPLPHKKATHLYHHDTAHTFKTSTPNYPSVNNDDSNDDKFRKPLKHSSTKTPKMHKTSSSKSWTVEENEDDELKTSKRTEKPTTQKTTTTKKSHELQHSTTKKYLITETPTSTEESSEIDYEDEYDYYLTEKPPTKSHSTKNSKQSKSTTPTSTKRPNKTTRPSKRMSPKHYSSESEENYESPIKNTNNNNDDENKNKNKRNKHSESNLSIKKIKKSKYDRKDKNDNIGNEHNKSNSSIIVKRENMARDKSIKNKKKVEDDEDDFENYDDKKVYYNKNGTCCQQITKYIQNLYKEHEDPESLLIYHLNNVTVVERDTLRTLYPDGTVIEEISDYLVDNNDDKIKIRTKVNIIYPDEYEEEEESDWN